MGDESLPNDGPDQEARIRAMADEIADLKIRVRGGNARIAFLSQTIEQRDLALVEQAQQIKELSESKRILTEAVNAIELHFRRLCGARPFRFAVYTARRLGLVSRNPRFHAEAIRNLFPQMRGALKAAKKNALTGKAISEARSSAGAPSSHSQPLKEKSERALIAQVAWRQIITDKLAANNSLSKEPLTMAFAVTGATPATRAGDFFAASELGEACRKEFGWRIRYLSQSDWYDLKDIDVLIVLLDSYEPAKIRDAEPHLVKVAWLRNWFERWASRFDFDQYDLFLCSSKKASEWLRQRYRKPASVFPLATNPDSFTGGKPENQLRSDYCFTGSNWQFEREIATLLNPQELPGYKFVVFGSGWETDPRLGAYSKGFVPYAKMPAVYASTRIVVDDANHVTREWGSVNSRVFDALAAGALVISNGEIGSAEIFDQELPTYRSADELQSHLRRYLGDESGRRALAGRLRERVLAGHTYRNRAHALKRILIEHARHGYRFAFKIGTPRQPAIEQTSDYCIARSLGRCLAAQGHSFRIDPLNEWDREESRSDDVVIVLRGPRRYRPKQGQINLIWHLTPQTVSDEEYEESDHVFLASIRSAADLADRLDTPVAALLPCTDPELFYPDPDPRIPAEPLLFIGDCGNQYPDLLRFAVEAELPVGVYGVGWERFVPPAYIHGKNLEVSRLRQYYSRAEIVLVNHSPAMHDHGFVANQLFDATASGAFVISDASRDAISIFGEGLVTCGNESEFRRQIRFYLAHPEERRSVAERLRSCALHAHTVTRRADEILAKALELDQCKRGQC